MRRLRCLVVWAHGAGTLNLADGIEHGGIIGGHVKREVTALTNTIVLIVHSIAENSNSPRIGTPSQA